MKKIFIICILAVLAFLFFWQITLAADKPLELQLSQPLGPLSKMTISGTSIGEYIKAVFGFGSAAVAALAIVMIVVGGIKWILSAGEPGKIGDAKNQILKALLGLFIAMFAIFVLQTLSPGTVNFKSIVPEGIVGLQCCQVGQSFSLKSQDACSSQGGTIVSIGMCQQGVTTAVCQEDLSKQCGESYTDPIGNQCIGKDCSAAGATKVCQQSGSAWICGDCMAIGANCSSNRDCCEGACDSNKICVSSGTIGGALGTSCGPDKPPCPSPLKCETNWFNSCGYGGTGHPCASTNECATEHYCSAYLGNICQKRYAYARCDPDNSLSCPSGFRCVSPAYCQGPQGNTATEYAQHGCKKSGSSTGYDMNFCLKEGDTCFCDCSEDSDCQGVQYTGITASKCANNTGINLRPNACLPGTYGTDCQNNEDCITGRCMTDGKNMCTQGDVGEGCANDAECRSGNKCCGKVCVPQAFNCRG